ncbi:MAG: stage III sporulation protein AF [Clostridium sp.]
METIKSLVTTLTAVLIFISAIEIIVPDKKMKKYISFVLGLILLSTILNPIVEFITNGEKSILQGIESYETVFSMEEEKINADGEKSYDETGKDNEDIRKRAFISNFNKNCDSILNN